MILTNWRARQRRRRVLLALEELEPRVTPSIYYVSPSGNDNNSGISQSAPWQTIAQVNRFAANSGFQPGDQILFQGSQTPFTGNLVFSANDGGAAGNPVTIGSYSGQATIDANDSGNGLTIDGASHVAIRNLIFVDGGVGTSPLADTGIFVTGNGSDITIDQVYVSGFGGIGISIDTDTSNVQTLVANIPPQDIYNFSRTGAYTGVSVTNSFLHDNSVGGLDAHNTTDLYVDHVQAYHNAGLADFFESGFGILEFSDDHSYNHAVVEFCEVHDNGYNPQSGGTCGGIELMGGTYDLEQYNESYDNRSQYDGEGVVLDATQDSIMQFNYTHGNDGWGLYLGMESFALPSGYDSNNVVRYNISQNDGSTTNDHGDGMILWQNVENSDIYNNTIYASIGTSSSWKTAFEIFNFTGNADSVRNNLFVIAGSNTPNVNQFIVNDGKGDGTNLVFQGNDYWPSGGAFTITWAGTTYGSEQAFSQGTQQETLNGQNVGLQENPRLIYPGGGGTIGNADQLNTLTAYQLASNSPLARAGLTLSQFGTTWDPYGFAGDPFLAKHFDTTPRDFYGNVLPATTPSVGAYQVEAVAPPSVIAVSAGTGGGPEVKVFNAETKAVMLDFFAYDPSFTLGVRVAVGDVNGDGIPDIITGAGPGGGSDIRIFDGQTGNLIREFSPYNPLFTGSQYIAAADLNHQGYDDIIVGADYGGGPDVIVFDGKTGAVLYNFFAYNPAFIGGVRVAAGDVLGNGQMDIICGAGPGGGPNVTIFQPNADGTVTPISSFFAYNQAFNLGIYVAAGDLQGNGKDEIITGAGAGGGPNVSVFDGGTGAQLASFFAYNSGFVGGVRVGTVEQSDGSVAVVTAAGPGGGPQVSEFNGLTGALIDSFLAYNPLFNAGLWVGGT